MEFGKAGCANSECEKTLGYYPIETLPLGLELYCKDCAESLLGQNKHLGSSFDFFLEEEKVKRKLKKDKVA